MWRQGGGPFLPSTCIIIIVAVWATVTEHHRLGGLSHKHLRLTFLETRKYKIKASADLVSGEDPLLHQQQSSHHNLTWPKEQNINASNIVANPIKALKWFTSKKSLKEDETMFNGSFIAALLIIINIGIIPNVY